MADLDSCEKQLQKDHSRTAKGGDKESIAVKALLEDKLLPQLERGIAEYAPITLDENERRPGSPAVPADQASPPCTSLTWTKTGFEDNPHFWTWCKNIAAEENAVMVTICNKLESEIVELDDEERLEFLQDLGMEEPGLDRVIRAGYELLNLQTYFTAGVQEVRAWTVKVGATAPRSGCRDPHRFPKRLHTRRDHQLRRFYCNYNGEQGAKDAGRWRLEGKEYIVQDGDVIHFRFNV